MLAGYLVKMALTSVMSGTKSLKPPFYHVRCSSVLLVYMISFPLSRKALATESVTGGFTYLKVCLPML